MPWTPAQTEAIGADSSSVLISAAAGSGKTAVLVERVIRLLREGCDIDRMLIVTFTRAAAAEMRERIEAALSREGAPSALRRQAARVGRAHISTLHSFCQRFLKDHFSQAGIDPAFRLSAESELLPLWEEALSESLAEAWADPDPDAAALRSQFDYEELEDLIPALRRALLSRAEPFAWARTQAAAGTALMMAELERCADLRLIAAGELLDDMEALEAAGRLPERYLETLQSDRAVFETVLKDHASSGNVKLVMLSRKKAPPDEDPALAENYKALRDAFRKALSDAAAGWPGTREAMEKAYTASLPALRGLIDLCEKADRKYFDKKQRKNRLDFNDLEHLTLRVLSDGETAREAGARFDHLFVDEYQDVSGIQESIVTRLHFPGLNTLFMVGDVKQSIYRFRAADPSLFMRKFFSFPTEKGGAERKILLNANFRSDPVLIAGINLVFRHAMRRSVTEIEYDSENALIPGLTGPENMGGDPVRVVVFKRDAGEKPAAEEETEEEALTVWQKECAWIAKEIRSIHDGEKLRVDGEPVRWRDIVVLLRSAVNRSGDLAKVLEDSGIPVYSEADARYWDLPEVRDTTLLCRAVVNPCDDIALMGVLRCPAFGFSSEELALIRLGDRKVPFHRAFFSRAEKDDPLGKKCAGVLRRLEEWRFYSRSIPLDTFLWKLIGESGLYLRAGADPFPEDARARLRLFAEQAQGENSRLDLKEFLTLRENERRAGERSAARTLSDRDDVVRIMTMHKSKGLQFPVVFMPGLAARFKYASSTGVQWDTDLGVAIRTLSPDRVELPNPALAAVKEKNVLKQKSEEARLMYVGMTRAKKRLYLLGCPMNTEKALTGRRPTAGNALKANSMLDWVLDALGGDALKNEGEAVFPGGERFLISFPELKGLQARQRDRMPPPPRMDPGGGGVPAAFVRDEKPRVPLKTSVTALAREMKESGDDTETYENKRREMPARPDARPRFLMEDTGLTGQERGTLIHRCLGAMDLDTVRAGDVRGAVEKLVRKGFFSSREAREVTSPAAVSQMSGFYASPLGRRMLKSFVVRREWAFDLHLKSSLAEYVQGVIDLCFTEEDEWVLCDYKTDRVPADVLKERYRKQLDLYKKALEDITGRKVKQTLLYSLFLGREIPIE
ncbi:MAG: UvrD-helicase domain-containing protein [Clostridia bacterium]|nr:UvrD-helicase domain-containing protein [Clostridia bacterium]